MLTDTQSMLIQARAEGYAVGAFNIYNLEGAIAVIKAAESMSSPVMLQILPSALQLGGKPLAAMCLSIAEEAKVPVGVHLDHCSSLETIKFALACGISSIMADGSDLSYTNNMRFTKEIIEMVMSEHPQGAVEAELGKISGTEDGVTIDAVEARYTDPFQAVEFIEATGVAALAVCIGNVHGNYAAPPRLDFDRLKGIAEKVSIPLVLHGTSGLPDTMITRAIEHGVCKFNVNTEVRTAYLAAMADLLTTGTGKADLLQLMHNSIEAMEVAIQQKLELFCSTNRA